VHHPPAHQLAGTVEQGGFFAPRLRFVDGGGTSVEITNYLFIAAPEGAGGR